MSSLVGHMSGAMLKHRGLGDDSENPLTPHSEDSDQAVNKSKKITNSLFNNSIKKLYVNIAYNVL